MASARIENDVPEAFMASARFEYNVPAAPMTSPQFNYRLPVPTEVSTRFDIQVQHAQNQVLANFHSKTQQQLAALTQWSNHRLHHLKKIMKDDPPAHLTPRAHSIRRALVAVQIRELKTLLGPNRLRKEIQYEQDMLLEGFQNTSIEALEDMIEVRDWELQLLRQFEDYTLSPDVCLHQAYVIALRKAELWDLYQLKCAWTRAVVGQYDFGGTMGGAAFCEGDEILEAEGVQSRAWEEEQRARQLEFAGDVPELVSSEEMPDLLISEET